MSFPVRFPSAATGGICKCQPQTPAPRWGDVQGAEADILSDPVYIVLNLPRVLAYAREGLVLSKAEGGRWALDHLPVGFQTLVEQAMCEYGGGARMGADSDMLTAYARFMLGAIRQAAELD